MLHATVRASNDAAICFFFIVPYLLRFLFLKSSEAISKQSS
jgi:hypothetical protein